MALRERIIHEGPQREYEKVEIVEWDATVEVRPMTLDDFISLGGEDERKKDEASFIAKVLIKSLFHDGLPIFQESDVEHVKALEGGILAPLINKAITINKLDVEEETEAKN